MNTYTITLTLSIEAESKEEALKLVSTQKFDDLNNGDNVEIEPELHEAIEIRPIE